MNKKVVFLFNYKYYFICKVYNIMIPVKNKNFKTTEQQLEKRKEKKELNIKYYEMVTNMHDLSISKNTKLRIRDCGTFLQFIADVNYDKHRLVGANFCGNRFCPHCSYNKARKDAYETYILVDYLKSQGYNFIFLTLTAPNVSGEDLEKELRSYYSSFERLMKRKEIKKVVKGYVRKLEVTYNPERNDYHPHYHVLIAVKDYYFTHSNYYISQSEWLDFWRKSKRDETITQVDVRRFNIDKDPTVILELTKYLSKDSNYLYSTEVFKTFYNALKGKREFSFNGEFKKARQLFKNGELDYLKEKDTTDYFYKLWFLWNGKNYKNNLHEILTPEEQKTYNEIYKKDMDID